MSIKNLILKLFYSNQAKEIADILTNDKSSAAVNYEKSVKFKRKIAEEKLKDIIDDIDYYINRRVEDGNFILKYKFDEKYKKLTKKHKKELIKFYRDSGYKVFKFRNKIRISWKR